MENIVEIIQEFWKVIPEVGLEALYVFLTVSLLKAVGVIKEDIQAQLGNLAAAWFANGGGLDVAFTMTAVVAGVYYHVWKLVKPYFAKALDYIMEKIGIKKLL